MSLARGAVDLAAFHMSLEILPDNSEKYFNRYTPRDSLHCHFSSFVARSMNLDAFPNEYVQEHLSCNLGMQISIGAASLRVASVPRASHFGQSRHIWSKPSPSPTSNCFPRNNPTLHLSSNPHLLPPFLLPL